MTAPTLTDRYVDAAMRTVPEQQRTDLATELRGSIDDQIEARVAEGLDAESAERAVLTDLGDPDKLAAQYTDRPLWLIGPRYYLDWWRLLKLLLWIVLPCAAFGVALGVTLSGAQLGEVVGTTIVVLFHTTVQLCFWVTLVFVVVERSSAVSLPAMPSLRGVSGAAGLPGVATPRGVGEWTVDQLPEPRESGASRGDMITSLVFLAIGAGAVLWDRFVGLAYSASGGGWMSFLSSDLWPWWIAGLFVVMALEAVLAIVVYVVGRWTVPLAVVNGVLALAVAIAAIWLLFQGQLVNPEFWPALIPADSAPTVERIISILLGFVIAGVAVWSTIDAYLKARRAR